MLRSCLYVAASEQRGRGVFTLEPIPADTIVEIAPVIVMDQSDRQHLDKTLLHDYIFEWDKNEDQSAGQTGKCCMALGLISIYNHSYQSNCEYFMDYDEASISVKTVRVVESGEELTINYNGDWDDAKPVWFNVE